LENRDIDLTSHQEREKEDKTRVRLIRRPSLEMLDLIEEDKALEKKSLVMYETKDKERLFLD